MTTSQQAVVPEGESTSPVDDFTPLFYVGHHEAKRPLPVTDFVLRQAQDIGVHTIHLLREYLLTVLV
jgi:protein arginine N-methyltransferase 5